MAINLELILILSFDLFISIDCHRINSKDNNRFFRIEPATSDKNLLPADIDRILLLNRFREQSNYRKTSDKIKINDNSNKQSCHCVCRMERDSSTIEFKPFKIVLNSEEFDQKFWHEISSNQTIDYFRKLFWSFVEPKFAPKKLQESSELIVKNLTKSVVIRANKNSLSHRSLASTTTTTTTSISTTSTPATTSNTKISTKTPSSLHEFVGGESIGGLVGSLNSFKTISNRAMQLSLPFIATAMLAKLLGKTELFADRSSKENRKRFKKRLQSNIDRGPPFDEILRPIYWFTMEPATLNHYLNDYLFLPPQNFETND
ncbi:hypothetical protein SSS_05119 [Sarcoptes scabiei]|uniref:Uncharacterized protein n=1 Tax=Sarcoptes scabiei TaxID=52283 RepID=A0A132AAU5_SARSC|nr:hypothetical protein SSS_05119 [Sarcoptes scabiei]KPM08102.1 hypothetical protein QR98_0066160 [Sarcoptes scabiei]UXI17372.1 F-box/LRR-repeat protein 2 [Sarcoptes scabiei]